MNRKRYSPKRSSVCCGKQKFYRTRRCRETPGMNHPQLMDRNDNCSYLSLAKFVKNFDHLMNQVIFLFCIVAYYGISDAAFEVFLH